MRTTRTTSRRAHVARRFGPDVAGTLSAELRWKVHARGCTELFQHWELAAYRQVGIPRVVTSFELCGLE